MIAYRLIVRSPDGDLFVVLYKDLLSATKSNLDWLTDGWTPMRYDQVLVDQATWEDVMFSDGFVVPDRDLVDLTPQPRITPKGMYWAP